MSKILDLIEDDIKNGRVEWKKLGEVCEFERGTSLTKKTVKDGPYPVVAGGQKPAYYHNSYNREGQTISIAGSGAYSGYVSFWQCPIFLSDAFSVKPNDILNIKYLYYYLLEKQNLIYSMQNGVGVAHVYPKDVSKIDIPVPPLKTQEKIVEILDNLTNYIEELETEVDQRTKQYEYYRDLLLSEEYLKKLTENLWIPEAENSKLRITTLGEIGQFIRGKFLQKKHFTENGRPVIHYGQIYTKFNFLTDKVLSYVGEEIFEKLMKAGKNDILITTTSENVEDVAKSILYTGDEEIGISSHMCIFKTEENSKYINYLLHTYEFQRKKNKLVYGTKVSDISINNLEKIKIVIPSITIQNKIVEILDKFRELTTQSAGLLPEEIEQRMKQYEYYREKLLTFETEESIIAKQQAASSKQQAASSKQQAASSKQQAASSKQQAASSKQQGNI